jgi:hypothetical protein
MRNGITWIGPKSDRGGSLGSIGQYIIHVAHVISLPHKPSQIEREERLLCGNLEERKHATVRHWEYTNLYIRLV